MIELFEGPYQGYSAVLTEILGEERHVGGRGNLLSKVLSTIISNNLFARRVRFKVILYNPYFSCGRAVIRVLFSICTRDSCAGSISEGEIFG